MHRIVLLAFLMVSLLGGLLLSEARAPFRGIAGEAGSHFHGDESTSAALHRALIETLDRLVTNQIHHRAQNGRLSESVSQLGSTISPTVRDRFEIVLERLGSSGFRILARSSEGEAASLDSNRVVRANFMVPTPSLDYLQQVALRHLRRASTVGVNGFQFPEEGSLFRGYFRYGIRASEKVAYASGIKAPVIGMYLEQKMVAPGRLSKGAPAPSVVLYTGSGTGQAWGNPEDKGIRRVFQNEIERYAQSFSDVAEIADFTRSADPVVDVELAGAPTEPKVEGAARARTDRAPASSLEVEPISSGN